MSNSHPNDLSLRFTGDNWDGDPSTLNTAIALKLGYTMIEDFTVLNPDSERFKALRSVSFEIFNPFGFSVANWLHENNKGGVDPVSFWRRFCPNFTGDLATALGLPPLKLPVEDWPTISEEADRWTSVVIRGPRVYNNASVGSPFHVTIHPHQRGDRGVWCSVADMPYCISLYWWRQAITSHPGVVIPSANLVAHYTPTHKT